MHHLFAVAAFIAALIAGPCAQAQNTLTIANTQQVDANGRPLSGALLYLYISNTTAPANIFQDAGLSIAAPNPLVADASGRLPMFYFSTGTIHARLTDASGVVQFDLAAALGVGNAAGGGGGGGSVDPTAIAQTGDLSFRLDATAKTGWVKVNAQTIGSAVSGATGRANADTQALFIYEWTNCPNTHCPVSSGRGASALADFNANKTLTLPDCRARICGVGLDDMGAPPAGRLQAINVTSGGGDGVTTPNATGGEAVHTISQAQLPNVTLNGNVTDSSVVNNSGAFVFSNFLNIAQQSASPVANWATRTSAIGNLNNTAVTTSLGGSGTAMNVMSSFMLGTWYLKL